MFVGQRSCQNSEVELELGWDSWTFPLVAQVPIGWSGTRQPPIRLSDSTAQDARYASPRGTSAPNLPTGFKSPGASTSACRSKVQKLNPTLGVSFLNTLALDHDKPQFLNTDASGLQPPDIDHQPPADSPHAFFLYSSFGP